MTASPAISFVIPVRNDAERLRRCLRSIRQGRGAADRVELLVADNGSTDGSADAAVAEGARVIALPGVRLGELRNRGAAEARAPIIAFVDADHEVGPEWTDAALAALTDPAVAAAGAPYHAPMPGTWVQGFYDRLRDRPAGRVDVDWLGSGNIAIRRAVFEAVGGFDTSLETCEDVDLCRKVRATGLRLVADDRLHSIHHGDPRTLGNVFWGELWRGRDNVRVSLRAPRSWRSLVSAAIPLVNLAALTTLVVAVLSLGAIDWRIAGLAALISIGLIALRATRLLRGSAAELPRALAVASAYELGRTFAIAARFGYGRRRPGAATS